MLRHMEYMKMRQKQADAQSDNNEMQDMVNHPVHYNKAGIETIVFAHEGLTATVD